MADKPFGPGSDDEYKYKSPEDMDVYNQTATTPGPENLPRRNFVVVIFIIVLAFSVYQLLSFFFGKRKDVKKVATPAKIEQPQLAVAKPKILSIQPSKPARSAAMISADIADKIYQQISPIERKLGNNTSKLSEHDAGLNEIRSRLNDIGSSISQVNEGLKLLHQQLVMQQKEIKEVKQLKLAKTDVVRETYYVKAIVAGRAWVANESGKTTTVSEGDKIPGYGVIELIDPEHGFLVTSSGDVMRYHPEDD